MTKTKPWESHYCLNEKTVYGTPVSPFSETTVVIIEGPSEWTGLGVYGFEKKVRDFMKTNRISHTNRFRKLAKGHGHLLCLNFRTIKDAVAFRMFFPGITEPAQEFYRQ